jgi:hypothetical protein
MNSATKFQGETSNRRFLAGVGVNGNRDRTINASECSVILEATKYRYRSVSGKKLKDPVTKKRIWFESCFVCDECEKEASREYDQFSFVPPYQK